MYALFAVILADSGRDVAAPVSAYNEGKHVLDMQEQDQVARTKQ